MNRITAILDPHADGTLHLPLPEALRHGKVQITATLEAAPNSVAAQSTPNRATPEMLRRRHEAFAALRATGGLINLIPDPAAWQREIRQDRPLPGRE